MAASQLDEILSYFNALPPAEQEAIRAEVYDRTAERLWFPNPGPQMDAAIDTQADELFYGGQAGGGKSDLIIGLALSDHQFSLLLRRKNKEAIGLEERAAQVIGNRQGLNSQQHIFRRPDGRVIEIGGCQFENDKQNYKGRPHDLIGFDEIADFSESQYRFIIAWNRTTKPGQRCRVVATGNPPTNPEGLWVLKYWGAWLDPTHPRPAREGELRWYTTIDGRDVECDGPTPVEVNGEFVTPKSRTFIRSKLSDNPDLAATNYDSVLAALPVELRDAYRDGKFDVVRPDTAFQVIPTEWIRAAQARWDKDGARDIPMSVLSHDVALGGGDQNAWARRHGDWYDEVVTEKLSGYVDPADLAAWDIKLMRDGCPIVIDMGGGYGSGVYSYLDHNVGGQLKLHRHNGAEGSAKRSRDGKLKFKNKRAEVYWRFREALEPGIGRPVKLPPDPELLADLAAPTWKLTPAGIVIEEKVELKKRLGRSPDKGDAVVNAWSYGEDAATSFLKHSAAARAHHSGGPKVITAHAGIKAKLRRGRG